jgi:hypothetical protein
VTEQPENQVPDEGAVPSWAPAQPADPAAAEPESQSAEAATAVTPPVAPTPEPPSPTPAAFPPPAQESVGHDPGASAGASSRPEVAIGAAFAGGFALAMLLKRLAR